jgi:hypothetical protein
MLGFLFETAVLVGLLWWGWFEFVGGEKRLEIGREESFFCEITCYLEERGAHFLGRWVMGTLGILGSKNFRFLILMGLSFDIAK